MDARQAHLNALRFIAETGENRWTHQDWSRFLSLVALRLQPFIRDCRLQQLSSALTTAWPEFGFDPGVVHHTQRGIFGMAGAAMWGLTDDLEWMRIVRVSQSSARISVIKSPGEISRNVAHLKKVYEHLRDFTRQRRARLESKIATANRALNEFDSEMNLLETLIGQK